MKISPTPPPSDSSTQARPRGNRGRSSRTDRLTTLWMLLAAACAVATIATRGLIPQNLWTMIHLVTLGVLTNSIFQWSWYFARALLHLPPGDHWSWRDNTRRILLFNAALVLLIISMWTGQAIGTVAGATIIGGVAAWHGIALVQAARKNLASRFAVVIRFYWASAAFLVVTAIIAGCVTVAIFVPSAPQWLIEARDALTLAHALSAVVGWVGLTMGGTLVTLGPTMLRTRMDPRAVSFAIAALPVWIIGLSAATLSALLSLLPGVALGLLLVVAAVILGVFYPLISAARVKGPKEYGSWASACGVIWLVIALTSTAIRAWSATDPTTLRATSITWIAIIGAGGLLQVLVGALTYLMPVVIGGGPSVVRQGIAILEVLGMQRLGIRNSALIVLSVLFLHEGGAESSLPLLPILCWLAVIATYCIDIVAFARGGIVQARAAREAAQRRSAPAAMSSQEAPTPRGPSLLSGGGKAATPPSSTLENTTPPAQGDSDE
ncbi:MAG: hypothetical protein Q4C87_08155 [Actinomycetaceae bacterium]|nr:hypothetical protein [Actinomycetaceae bacterium]